MFHAIDGDVFSALLWVGSICDCFAAELVSSFKSGSMCDGKTDTCIDAGEDVGTTNTNAIIPQTCADGRHALTIVVWGKTMLPTFDVLHMLDAIQGHATCGYDHQNA